MQSNPQWIFANVASFFERTLQPVDLLIDVGIKATVLILLAIMAACLLRHASAAVRHRMWGLMFFGLLLLPLASYALPAWQVPILPALASESTVKTPQPTRSIAARSDSIDDRLDEPRDSELLAVAPPIPLSEMDDREHASSGDGASSSTSDISKGFGAPYSLGRTQNFIAVIIWAIGVFLVLLPLLVGILHNGWLRLRSDRMDDSDWRCLLAEAQGQIGLRRRVNLLFSDRLMIPVTWGLFRPNVLLPRQARAWTNQLRRFVLLHELSHVKRWDVGFQMIARVACALFWFHPLAWYALRRIRIERETACDDLVLSTGEPAADYAEQLVAIARTFRPARLVAAVAMAHPNSLEHRVTAILDQNRPRLAVSSRSATILFVVAVGIVTGIAVVEPSAMAASSNRARSPSRAFTFDEPIPSQNSILQDVDDVFTKLEPGVRILGNPGARSVLGEVLDLATLPDGNRIVTVCRDGLKIWDIEKDAIVDSLPFEQPITTCSALQFSNDQQTLAISTWSHSNLDADQPGVVMLVDQQLNLKAKFTISDQTNNSNANNWNHVTALEFSPDDSKIALATSHAVLVFDVDSEEMVDTFDMGVEPAHQSRLRYERDRIFVFGSQSRLIDLTSATVSRLPESHAGLNSNVQSCFDASSNRLFGWSRPGKLRAIRLSDGTSEPIEFAQEGSIPFNLKLSRDGSLLAICHFERETTKNGPTVNMMISVVSTHGFELKYRFANLPLRPSGVEFTADNDGLLVTFNMDSGFKHLKFDPQEIEQKPTYQLNRPLRSVLLSNDGSHLVGSFQTTQTSSWDWKTGEETRVDSCNSFLGAEFSNHYFAVSQRGTTLSLVEHTFGTDQPKEILAYPMKQPILGPLSGFLLGFSKKPAAHRAYYVIPATLAINESKSALHVGVLDTLSGIRIQTFGIPGYKKTKDQLFKRPSEEMMTKKIAISNDGKRLAVVDSGKLKVIDVESGDTLFEQPANKHAPLFFSKNRDWLAISNQRGVLILDAETGNTLKKMDATAPLVAYAIGSDRLLIAPTKKGSTVRIFDTETWDITVKHATQTDKRISATISSDGRRVAFALDNCCLEFWDIGKLKP